MPQRFKLDDSGDGYIAAFGSVVSEVFSNFPEVYREMAGYRERIKQEESLFKEEVRDFFGLVKTGEVWR
ncbi:hypothetical protein JKG47_22210 [Acidithiobacillus sp. MC6.1]|nr:hypothetical protein [Acidithiobacillus sp. MC6.1]